MANMAKYMAMRSASNGTMRSDMNQRYEMDGGGMRYEMTGGAYGRMGEQEYERGYEEMESRRRDSRGRFRSEGEMYIEGRDIKIDTLDTEKGVVALSGRINGVYYANDTGKEKKGFFGGLFR